MSKDTISLKIMTASGVMEEGEYHKINAEGAGGCFGILPGHISFITPLVPCVLHAVRGLEEDEIEEELFAVMGGFFEVHDDRALVLATAAEHSDKIDEARAKRAEERARERLTDRAREDIDFVRAEAALERALVRLRAVGGDSGEE